MIVEPTSDPRKPEPSLSGAETPASNVPTDPLGLGAQAAESAADREGVADRQQPGRMRIFLLIVATASVALFVALLLLPQTLPIEAGARWSLRVSVGVVGPRIQLVDTGQTTTLLSGGRADLTATRVVEVVAGGEPATIVAGHTPGGAASIRVSTAEHGVGEAAIRRVGWRRVHVAVLPAQVEVTNLVAIGADGRVLDVVELPDQAAASGAVRPG